MLRDKSYFKKSTGDEPATRALGMGVVTHTITGKVYFTSWSMDVKIEGENAVRHLDLTTHNHMSKPGNTPPWPHTDTADTKVDPACKESFEREKLACNPEPEAIKGQKGVICTKECEAARACKLVPFKEAASTCCAPDTCGDHLLEASCFIERGGRNEVAASDRGVLIAALTIRQGASGAQGTIPANIESRPLEGFETYDENAAPTACASLPYKGTHKAMQRERNELKARIREGLKKIPLKIWPNGEESFWTYRQASRIAAISHKRQHSQCDILCTLRQIDAYHHPLLPGEDADKKGATPLRTHIPQREAKWHVNLKNPVWK